MQIICDNKEEYEALMKASRYIHNFEYDVSTPYEPLDCDKWKTKGLDLTIPMLNMLAHLHVSENPDLVIIKGEN